MKKIIAVLIAFTLLLTMLPTSVMATEETEEKAPITTLYVGTVNALENPEGEGWSFDADSGVLTLDNCDLYDCGLSHTNEAGTISNAIIYFMGDLTIQLENENYVTNYCYNDPESFTSYCAIYASTYKKIVDGEEMDVPSKLSIKGSGYLYCGVSLPSDALYWENLDFSCGIHCSADGGVDLTGLSSGAQLEVYGGVVGVDRAYIARAWNTAPTFNGNSLVLAYGGLGATAENEYGYNWNNNDAWYMQVICSDAYLKDNGMLILMNSGSKTGEGWTWENNILTLSPDSQVKAVNFLEGLDYAKLELDGDVTLDGTDMGMDSNYNNYGAINTYCDLEIDAGAHTLSIVGENTGIRVCQADLFLMGGTIEFALNDYCESINSQGGNVTIKGTDFHATCLDDGEQTYSGAICLTNGYDADYNTVPAGDLLIDNSNIYMNDSIYTNDGRITVNNSVMEMNVGYQGIGCSYEDIFFNDSAITMTGTGTLIYADYGVIEFNNCDLDLVGVEGEPLLLAARYYSSYIDDPDAGERDRGEPDVSAIRFLNMNIDSPNNLTIGYDEEESSYGYTYGYVTLKDDAEQMISSLQATRDKVQPTITQKGANLSYEDLIRVIDIFDVQNAEDIDLTTDAGMLIFTSDEYAAMKDNIIFDEEHAVVGLKAYKETGYYYAISDGIYTRDLHVENYYIGYLKLSDGSYVFSEAKLYNPAIYADNMMNKDETDSKTRDLCVALLNFNAAAQMYFNPDTEQKDLVNSGLSEEEKELDWTDVALNLAPVIPEEVMVERDTAVFTATGKNLLFEEMISLGAIYKIDDAIVEDAIECGTIFWTAEEFEALNGVPGLDNIGDGLKMKMSQYRGRSGQWVSNAPKIAAKDMADTEYYFLGYVVHKDGSVSYSGMMSYTIEQYISNMAGDADMENLVKSLYYYERAAKAALLGEEA